MRTKQSNRLAIVFATREQALAYSVEMCGQVSDGQWENSRPLDHYKPMIEAEIGFSDKVELQGCYGFRPMRKYNFANKELFEVIGFRCRNTIALYSMYPKLDVDSHWDYTILTESESVEQIKEDLGNKEKYFRDKNKQALASLGIKAKQAPSVWEAIQANAYSLKSLREDLKAMSKIVNNNYKSGIPSKGITWIK